jgi:hypothetical protein
MSPIYVSITNNNDDDASETKTLLIYWPCNDSSIINHYSCVYHKYPSSSIARKVYYQPQYQKCLDEFTEIYDMDGDNKLN